MKEINPALHKTWGRSSDVSLGTLLGCIAIFVLSPLLVFYFYVSAMQFEASLIAPLQFNWDTLPKPSLFSFSLLSFWILFQIVLALLPDRLHKWIPNYQGGETLGAVTPAGNRLKYNINGLQAWIISHLAFIMLSFGLGLFSPTIVFDYWGEILWLVNIGGFLLASFAYIKAYLFPSFPEDRKFSGLPFYDFFMGIELNPRVGPIDLKLFFNGRPGIIGWSIINLSFASAQYSIYGYVTTSMILVNFFQLLYILYFFWKEAWYLNTIDIHHDHFGWMLAWGDMTWLPFMYTLQALFLVIHPVELSIPYALFVLLFGLIGFYIFASANNQKDRFRKDENTLIWGKKPEFLSCEYKTQDGEKRTSKLLLSGWWGVSRHFNYTGDLMLSLAYSLACGVGYFFPYFYFIFLSSLLIHRCIRDEKRCEKKYGRVWKEYTEKVPYRLIPYIW